MRHAPWRNDPDWKTLATPAVDVTQLSQQQLKAHETDIRWNFMEVLARACLTREHASCKACSFSPSKKPNYVWNELLRGNYPPGYYAINEKNKTQHVNITLAELRQEYAEAYKACVSYAEEIRAHFLTHKTIFSCKCGKVHKNSAAAKKHETTITCNEVYRNILIEKQGYKEVNKYHYLQQILDLVNTRYTYLLGFIPFEDQETLALVKQEKQAAIEHLLFVSEAGYYLTRYVVQTPTVDAGQGGWQEQLWMPAHSFSALDTLQKVLLKQANGIHEYKIKKSIEEQQIQTALNYLLAPQDEQENILGCLELQLAGM